MSPRTEDTKEEPYQPPSSKMETDATLQDTTPTSEKTLNQRENSVLMCRQSLLQACHYLSFQLDTDNIPTNYSFLIRGLTRYAIAKGVVSHTAPDLKTVLHDVCGNEILEVRKQVPSSALVEHRDVRKFDVRQDGKQIGLIAIRDKEPAETYLQIYRADGEALVVRSLTIGEFSVFRDQSSRKPICCIETEPFEYRFTDTFKFDARIKFDPEQSVEMEEKQLCVAAAISHKIWKAQRETTIENERNTIGIRRQRIVLFFSALLGLIVLMFIFRSVMNADYEEIYKKLEERSRRDRCCQ